MKAYHVVILFLLLIGSSAVVSVASYRHAERMLVSDMNQALKRTLTEQQSLVITPDTISTYRNYLQLECLKENSLVCYDVSERTNGLRSRAMLWKNGRKSQAFRGYANCSMATVFSLSDQRPAALLAFLAFVSLAFGVRRKQSVAVQGIAVGGLTWNATQHRFYNNEHVELHFTPMQRQLMEMFFQATDNRLSKQEICDRLWPKKPDPSATLYTLIRRLRPILEQNSTIKIETERGGDYQLKS
jgi:hypothetical protein